jgi:hypothetical protein
LADVHTLFLPNPDVESHESTHCPTGAAEAKPDETECCSSVPIGFVFFVAPISVPGFPRRRIDKQLSAVIIRKRQIR